MDCQLPDGMANFAAVTLNPRWEWEEEGEHGGRAFSWAFCYPSLSLLTVKTSIDDVQSIGLHLLLSLTHLSIELYQLVCPGLLNLWM